jgi:peptidoglycan/xylan/chitin deacetylase (PgdA/CDA1 family)
MTDLQIVQPWTPAGLQSSYSVAATVQGSCFSGALAAARTDAWRCSAEAEDPQQGAISQIYDPCLANPFDAESPLACISPDGDVTLLRLEAPLPQVFANPPAQHTLPLSLTLDNGDTCNLATGATITVEGVRVNYLCASGGVLIGEPNRDDAIWTARYSAGGRGSGDILTVGIASAVAFRGDTATVGWSSGSNRAGALRSVAPAPDAAAGVRLVFTFGEGGLPDYEIGYVNEPVVNSAGETQATAGQEKLRLWFRYPEPETPAYAGDPRVVIEGGENVNSAILGRSDGGDLVWYVDLDAKAGFDVLRSEDRRQLMLDLYPPEPALGRLPDVAVGSYDRSVEALSARLFAAGYLDERPADGVFDETIRQAVARFEADHGLVPDGVASPETWALLLRDVPPARSTTAARDVARAKRVLAEQSGQSQVTPFGDQPVNVRSGPGLDFSAIGLLSPGEFADVVSILPGTDPVTTWYEVCCFSEQNGWVRADVVRPYGPGEVPPAQDPPTVGDLGGIDPMNRPSRTAEGAPILYFTFDDGPMDRETRAVMDILEANDAHGTFFAIGRQVTWLPDLAREQVTRGHSVQNHTYSHTALDTVDRAGFFSEVESTQNAIYAATDTWATCLRPPYGATDGYTFQLAGELGLDVVLWTVDTQDWMRPGTEVLVDYILANASPGAIMLMHDGGGERDQTIAALEAVLPRLAEQGYVFASLCSNE